MDWGLAKVTRETDRPDRPSGETDIPDRGEEAGEERVDTVRTIRSESREGPPEGEKGGKGEGETAGEPAPGTRAGPRGRRLTVEGQVLGTPSYMPPEQATGRMEEVDELSDVFALGGILYAILTHEAPIEADFDIVDYGPLSHDNTQGQTERETNGNEALHPLRRAGLLSGLVDRLHPECRLEAKPR